MALKRFWWQLRLRGRLMTIARGVINEQLDALSVPEKKRERVRGPLLRWAKREGGRAKVPVVNSRADVDRIVEAMRPDVVKKVRRETVDVLRRI